MAANWNDEMKKAYVNETTKRKRCPMIFGEIGDNGSKCSQCFDPVPNEYFNRICDTSNYSMCLKYNKEIGGLKSPMEWLQKKAQIEKVEPDEHE